MQTLSTGWPRLAVIIALASLAACGGGGSNAPAMDDGGGGDDGGGDVGGGDGMGGIDRGGIAIGVISGFGSVIVGGVRYDTDGAEFIIDDQPGTEADLAVGQRVRLKGTQDDDGNGVAELVEYEAEVEGPIAEIDLDSSTLLVLGQTIEIRNDTLFDDDLVPGSIEGLMVGDFVEVSGFAGAEGLLVATRVEVEDDAEFEVTGIVRNLDLANQTFTLSALTVDYSMAMLEDFANGELADGLLVEAEGTELGAGGELIALRVENEADDDDPPGDGDFAELEGLVTAFTSASEFSVAGTPVTTTADTVFEDGTADDLALNLRVEVEGTFDAEGTLVAAKVEIDEAYNLDIEGRVQAVDLAEGSLVVLGLTIFVDAQTRFEDDSDAGQQQFGLEDLMVGDFVEIVASQDEDTGVITARSLERDDDDDDDDMEVSVQGFIDAIDPVARTLTVLGITIVADPDDAEDFDEVFDQAMVGDLIEAEGVLLADNVLQADELEFETPDDNDGDDDDDDDDD
ncbi:MAG: DUF5666 domain-containing protein [Pseudomonadota bacterium]